jgi:exosortase/archaeosortase
MKEPILIPRVSIRKKFEIYEACYRLCIAWAVFATLFGYHITEVYLGSYDRSGILTTIIFLLVAYYLPFKVALYCSKQEDKLRQKVEKIDGPKCQCSTKTKKYHDSYYQIVLCKECKKPV